MFAPLYYITQLPEHRADLQRKLDVLRIAEGFTPQHKADLIALYEMLLDKVNEIMSEPATTNPENL